jgi:hypothetical protein
VKRLFAAVPAVLLAGCMAAVPFKHAAPAALGEASPQEVVLSFKEGVPGEFNLLSSIVFDYGFVAVSGIGYLDIDTSTGKYKVACLNHLGVKFFEFEGDRGGITSQYVIEPLARQGNITEAVGADIRRIYLDLIPSPEARAAGKGDRVLFRQRSGKGALEYEFGGEGANLVTKTYREDERAVWRVSYYEYQSKDGKRYPTAIVLRNFRYGYRLIVRQKEIRS